MLGTLGGKKKKSLPPITNGSKVTVVTRKKNTTIYEYDYLQGWSTKSRAPRTARTTWLSIHNAWSPIPIKSLKHPFPSCLEIFG